jgi:hypothetical protein
MPSRIIFSTSFEKGEAAVAEGRFRRVKDQQTGEHVGYQIMPEHLRGEKAHV